MSEEVVLKLTIDDKEFDVKIAADSKAIETLRKQFEQTSKGSSNSIAGLKKNLDQLVNKFEDAEIGSEEFKKLKAEVDKTRSAIQKAEKNIGDLEKPSKSVLEVFSQWGNIVTGLNQALEVAQKLYSVISKPIAVAGEFERYEVQFEVLLGGIRETKARINELSEFAAKTPFDFPEIIRASKQLEVMTKGALATGEGLRMIGDVSAGVGVPIDELSMWFGRLYDSIQNGRPAGEAMMRLQELGAMSGKARGKIEDLMKTNSDSKDVWKAVTDEMGRYDGMMEKQSETYEGMVSNLEDSITLLYKAIGENLLPGAKETIATLIDFVEAITPLKTNVSEVTNLFGSQITELDVLQSSYVDLRKKTSLTADEHDRLGTIINTLQNSYPDYFKNMDLEKGKLEDINTELVLIRENLVKNMRVELRKAELKDIISEQEEIISKKNNILDEIAELNARVKGIQLGEIPNQQTFDKGLDMYVSSLDKAKNAIKIKQQTIKDLNNEIAEYQVKINKKLEGVDLGEKKKSGGGNDDEELTNKQIKSELELYKLRNELNELSNEDYKKYLADRVANLKSGTAEEKKILLAYKTELEKVDKGITKDNIDKNKKELELNKLQKDLLQTSLEDYKTYLENRIKTLKSGTVEEKKILLQYQKELDKTNKEIDKKDKVETRDERDFSRLEIDAIADKYEREKKILDNWLEYQKKKWEGNQTALDNIEEIHTRKRERLDRAAAMAKLETAQMVLGHMAGIFAQNTAFAKTVAIAQVGASSAMAQMAALEPPPTGLGPVYGWALLPAILAEAGLRIHDITSTGTPSLPGYVKGGIVIGEKGPEIIAPMQDYAEGQADLVNKAVLAVEHRLTAIQFQNAGGLDSQFIIEIRELNNNMKNYYENPIPPVITKDAVGKLWRDGRKFSKGYRG